MAKNKLKTNKGTAKRFKVSGSGKLKCSAANHNHMLSKNRSRKRNRRLTKVQIVDKSDVPGIERLLNIK